MGKKLHAYLSSEKILIMLRFLNVLDMHEARLRYEATLYELKERLNEALEEATALRKHQQQAGELANQVVELESKLQDTVKQSDELRSQLEVAEQSKFENERVIRSLRSDLKQLQETLRKVENEVGLYFVLNIFRYV